MANKDYYDNAHNTLGEWAKDPNNTDADQRALNELIGETREQSEKDGVTAERAKVLAGAAVKAAKEDSEVHADSDWRKNPDAQ